jgi:hypothetical protein
MVKSSDALHKYPRTNPASSFFFFIPLPQSNIKKQGITHINEKKNIDKYMPVNTQRAARSYRPPQLGNLRSHQCISTQPQTSRIK